MVITRMKQSVLSLATAMYVVAAAANETTYPLVTYKCNVEDDIVTLTNSLLKNDEATTFKYSDEDGTYSPWDLIEIEQRTTSTRIVRTKKITKVCKLSSGEYTITLEPKVFNQNLSGTCGSSISSIFTVSYGGFNIQSPTPFENYCLGNSPIITRVTVFGKTGKVKIKRISRYKFY